MTVALSIRPWSSLTLEVAIMQYLYLSITHIDCSNIPQQEQTEFQSLKWMPNLGLEKIVYFWQKPRSCCQSFLLPDREALYQGIAFGLKPTVVPHNSP